MIRIFFKAHWKTHQFKTSYFRYPEEVFRIEKKFKKKMVADREGFEPSSPG